MILLKHVTSFNGVAYVYKRITRVDENFDWKYLYSSIYSKEDYSKDHPISPWSCCQRRLAENTLLIYSGIGRQSESL